LDYFAIVVSFHGTEVVKIGLIVYDASVNSLEFRFRPDVDQLSQVRKDDRVVLKLLEDDLSEKAHELGALTLIEWLERHCRNAIRVSERIPLMSPPTSETVESLFKFYVLGEKTSAAN
jgi:hypothetical protein